MRCVICGELLTLERGEVCSKTECVDEWLKAGHGSVSGDEYKRYMDRCLKAVMKQQGERVNGEEKVK